MKYALEGALLGLLMVLAWKIGAGDFDTPKRKSGDDKHFTESIALLNDARLQAAAAIKHLEELELQADGRISGTQAELQQCRNIIQAHEKKIANLDRAWIELIENAANNAAAKTETFPEPNEPESCK